MKTLSPYPRRVAVIGNHVPRQCGIATFTADLCEALASVTPRKEVFAVAMNDTDDGYDYPSRVRFTIRDRDPAAYFRVAEALNTSRADIICLQHEYGIFGGPAGNYLLPLLNRLQMPIVTTLHTVLHRPDNEQRWVMHELARLSARLVVMSQRSISFLRTIYGVPAEKIIFIPHGIPSIPGETAEYKELLGLQNHTVLLTFGLLSANKGIENVIAALPQIVERHPDVLYAVVGATHPHVLRNEGEAYRESLTHLAQSLGVAEHIRFYNQFVSLEELSTFIGASDIYITPYLNPEQAVSGTLSYVLGNGKPVISTPYWHAEELLQAGRGILVPFKDPDAIARHTVALLSDTRTRRAISKRAYVFGRQMLWPNVGQQYMDVFANVLANRVRPGTPTVPGLGDQGGNRILPGLRRA